MRFANMLLQDLRTDGDAMKQALYRMHREKGPSQQILKTALTQTGSPSLLDRVQESTTVEGSLRILRRRRLKERGNTVYVPLQAKASLKDRGEACFPLMEKLLEFLNSNRGVFLLLGDSGAGKSTFNRELECYLWQAYEKNGTIPLYIDLSTIDRPEHDMIAKRLRKAKFAELQIQELKANRQFILICDGYDESQHTHNLYTNNRINEPGEWQAKMVISCRSEHIGLHYQDRFYPKDYNYRSDPTRCQEAVIMPFSTDQVKEYINQYVSLHQPMRRPEEVVDILDRIPSLKDLMRNPLVVSLSLEVLSRMMDLVQGLSVTRTAHITRVEFYDHLIDHWYERGRKMLGEKDLSPKARATFESMNNERFTRHGIGFFKKLCVAIYKNQDGEPTVVFKDESSWKTEFFGGDDERQLLLREACPLIHNGHHHQFIHRSLLEYGLALAVFDPQDWKAKNASHPPSGDLAPPDGRESDLESPLAWRSLQDDPSVLQFLEERVQQEPLFKQRLLDYIERSKMDRKWQKAAANANTILVRAGV
ncbi:MAG: hypothetical protein J3Q66DRAFT_93735 [Benniella sp.]|nr:MAG: hypothetical protein J3Q66DRAFT_93735 [Benniella sp.]